MNFGVPKIPLDLGCFLLLVFGCISSFQAQELTGEWTGSDSNRTASACGISVSTEVSNTQNSAFVTFTTERIDCAMPNTFSNNTVLGQPSLAPFLGYGTTGGTGVLTFNFSAAVTDPVIHIDRLGGVRGNLSAALDDATSALLTLISPGITLQRISGNGPHFEVTANEITRTPDQLLNRPPNPECGGAADGAAAGSVRLVGTFTSVSFRFEKNGVWGDADAIEILWELFCTPPEPDFDNDGIPDVDDLDDDNDGILDTVEQGGVPTLDTDSDGQIDSLDLDSDGDGCNDVLEAGFGDPDDNGTLGIAPDEVDANGLIINTVDGYTTPNDLNMNSVFDFQESLSQALLQHPSDQVVCEGEDAQFQVLLDHPTPMTWELSTDNGTTWNDIPNTANFGGINTETLRIINTTALQNGIRFRVRLNAAGSVCDPVIHSESSELRVLQTANAGQDAVLRLCRTDGPIALLDILGDEVDLGGSWNPTLNNGDHIFDPATDAPGTYRYTVGSGNCEASAAVEITLQEDPEITSVDITNSNAVVQVVISVAAPETSEYALDGITFQTGNTFEISEAGQYTVTVRSTEGCGTTTETFQISGIYDYPRFFTPNQDGINDTWQIEQLRLPDSQTYIYDRYGKLLRILNGEDERWDGTYRNKRMPATDYWFKAVSNNEIILKGHFSLKR